MSIEEGMVFVPNADNSPFEENEIERLNERSFRETNRIQF